MKKRLFIGLMLITMSLALYGCKNEEKTKEDENVIESTESESPYDQDGDGYLDGWY